jgi:pimeloyl-ACP methyl ester carboxylesterase
MAHSSMRRGLMVLLPCLLAGCADSADPQATSDSDLAQAASTVAKVDFPVKLRESGRATIQATVYENPAVTCGRTLLALHGLAETAATFEPLAQAVFADTTLGKRIQRVVAIDLVGHGGSSLPTDLPAGVTFGTLTIDDNVSVLLQSIDALRAKELAPDGILGHSMGGLAVQAAQERLLASGSSFAKLGIRDAVLVAPVPAHGRPWTQPPPADLSAFMIQDPTLGTYVALAPPVFIAQAFTTTRGTPASNAPTPEVVAAKGYVGKEPLLTILQLIEAPLDPATMTVLPRPSVRERAFAAENGTRLRLLSFAEDTLVPAADLGGLYDYLTGTTARAGYAPIASADAVHSMYISNPTALLSALAPLGG